ncbi:MFS transporter [Pseudonocardiaceae bacterium YIM PH 21723]|nr:MFS transporter [Pseudonocardiaceae bacterium YIM PH 21723]
MSSDVMPAVVIEPGRGSRNATVLVGFTAITNLADGVAKAVLPLLATQITGSPGLITAVGVALRLPWLLVSLHVGVLVDRFDRRLLLWIADGVRAAVMFGVLALVSTGRLTIEVLLGAGFLLGVAEVVALTAATALIPAAVPEPARERTNAWIAGAETVGSEFAGPAIGGLLVALGTAAALGATGVTYVLATALLVLLAGRFRPRRVTGRSAGGVNREIAEGLRFLWRQPMLRLMALALTVLCASWGAWIALLPAIARPVWGYTPQEYGIAFGALGVGGLVGSLTVGWVNRLLGRRWALFADLVGTAVMMAVPAVTGSLIAVCAAAFAGGMGAVLWTVNARTISQALVPDELLGRYSAAARLFSWGSLPVGGAVAAVIAEWVSPAAAFWPFTVLTLAIMVPFLRATRRSEVGDVRGRNEPEHRQLRD